MEAPAKRKLSGSDSPTKGPDEGNDLVKQKKTLDDEGEEFCGPTIDMAETKKKIKGDNFIF